MKRLARAAALSIATLAGLTLVGCGFHMAGSRPLPTAMKSVYIDVVAPYRVSEPPVETSLRARLLRQGAKVTKQAEGADAIIKLSNLNEGRQVLSTGGDGKALEYLLIATVNYEVHSGGKLLVPIDTVRVARAYSFNADQILAKEAEEARLRDFIQDEMAELLLLRVESRLSAQGKAGPPVEASPAASVPVAPAAAE